jgi:hypothetical protein
VILCGRCTRALTFENLCVCVCVCVCVCRILPTLGPGRLIRVHTTPGRAISGQVWWRCRGGVGVFLGPVGVWVRFVFWSLLSVCYECVYACMGVHVYAYTYIHIRQWRDGM